MRDSSGTDNADFRTRAVILCSDPSISILAQQIFRTNDINAAWVSNDTRNGSDFLILSTGDINTAAAFKPTIAMIGSGFTDQNWQSLPENITPGGILIYPQVLENGIPETSVFFRKLPFETADYQMKSNEITINTDFGELSLGNLKKDVARDLRGLQLFCSQFGIMEEDFFATLAELY